MTSLAFQLQFDLFYRTFEALGLFPSHKSKIAATLMALSPSG
jgi:hypothetical protein